MLEGERIIITGASRGLGREMALRFSREGARVTLVARNEPDLRAVADAAPSETLIEIRAHTPAFP